MGRNPRGKLPSMDAGYSLLCHWLARIAGNVGYLGVGGGPCRDVRRLS